MRYRIRQQPPYITKVIKVQARPRKYREANVLNAQLLGRFFNEIFYPLYQKKVEEENEQESAVVIQGQLLSAQNKITALYPGTLTANEICDHYNLHNPKSPINTDNLRKIGNLISNAYVDVLIC